METTTKPKLTLVGEDGNAMSILARARREWRRAGLPNDQWGKIQEECMSGDYDHLLGTIMEHFDTDPVDEDDEE